MRLMGPVNGERPQLFCGLARKLPDVTFPAAGRSRDPTWEQELRSRRGRGETVILTNPSGTISIELQMLAKFIRPAAHATRTIQV